MEMRTVICVDYECRTSFDCSNTRKVQLLCVFVQEARSWLYDRAINWRGDDASIYAYPMDTDNLVI